MLKTTPFHSRTAALCEGQNWRRWAGYLAASSYELVHEREYHAIRSAAALFDITPLYKYRISGRDAVRLLDRVVTRDVTKCRIGQMMYTPWCDERGKVIDDGTVARLDETVFRMTAADPNLRWLQDNAVGLTVEIQDVSESVAALSLQGPTARRILQDVVDADLEGLRFFRVADTRLRHIPLSISRSGYTGDLGYEIWVDNRFALDLWDTLIDVGTPFGLSPAGLLALDVARIEAGLLLIEVDYISSRRALIEMQTSTPYELNLGWTVHLDKGPFVGKAALEEEHARGPAWQLVGLEVEWDSLERLYFEEGLAPRLPTAAWRTSVPVYAGGRQVGYATSGCWSPLLKKYIALAHLEAACAQAGSPVSMEITVEHRRKRAGARVTRTPFFSPERKRA
jgi:aminomethyltransferase